MILPEVHGNYIQRLQNTESFRPFTRSVLERRASIGLSKAVVPNHWYVYKNMTDRLLYGAG